MDSYYVERIARLEGQVAALYQHLGLSSPDIADAVPDDVPGLPLFLKQSFYDAIRNGNKIEAELDIKTKHAIVEPSYSLEFVFDDQDHLIASDVEFLGYVGL